MVRNLGCFRLLSGIVMKTVSSGVSVSDKRGDVSCDLRGMVALLEAESGVTCFISRMRLLLRVQWQCCAWAVPVSS